MNVSHEIDGAVVSREQEQDRLLEQLVAMAPDLPIEHAAFELLPYQPRMNSGNDFPPGAFIQGYIRVRGGGSMWRVAETVCGLADSMLEHARALAVEVPEGVLESDRRLGMWWHEIQRARSGLDARQKHRIEQKILTSRMIWRAEVLPITARSAGYAALNR